MTQTPDATKTNGDDTATVSEEYTLHVAVSRGDAAEIARLLASGADVRSRDALGRTPLLVAAREGQIDATRLLLGAGTEIDERGEGMQITALMAAAQRGDAPLVRALLGAGADPNAVSRNGAGVLARAIVGSSIETARVLLEAGANPNGAGASSPPNTAPLWAAVALKHHDLIRLLIGHGARVNIGDSTTDTLFGIAVSGGDAGIARTLLEAGADPLRPALANLPLLAVAMRFSNPSMAGLLEEYGLSLAMDDSPH